MLWSVKVSKPKGRERGWYLRARRTQGGRREEKRQSTGTEDLGEAQALAAEWSARLNGSNVAANPTVLAVVDARIAALELDPQAEESTLIKYRLMRRIVAATSLAHVRAGELTRAKLLSARDEIQASGRDGRRANSTVNSTVIFLASCWRWAADRELVRAPWPKIEPLDESKPARPKRAYTPDEIESVLDYVREHDPSWYPPFALLAATGARLNDVLSLRSQDVLRSAGVVMLKDPKTHEPNDVGVPADVLALLPERPAGAFLFPSRSSARAGDHLTDSGALRCLRRALRALKIPDAAWLDLHSFRRSFCADAEDAGVSPHQARKQTGHKNGATYDHYASKARGRKRETAEKVHAWRRARAGADVAPNVAPTPPMEPVSELVPEEVRAKPTMAAVLGRRLASRSRDRVGSPAPQAGSPSSASPRSLLRTPVAAIEIGGCGR